MKRFYKLVSTSQSTDGGYYSVLLDGKPIKTPSGAIVQAPTKAIADLVMAEWAAQGDVIDPKSMDMMQILVTAQDNVGPMRADIAAQVADYLDTDLVFYRTNDPPQYADRQKAVWDPVVCWLEKQLGAALQTTFELSAIKQPKQAHDALASYMGGLSLHEFTIFSVSTAETGSVALAMALVQGEMTPDDVFTAARIEEIVKGEIYREDLYGAAPHEEKGRALLKRSLDASAVFLQALK